LQVRVESQIFVHPKRVVKHPPLVDPVVPIMRPRRVQGQLPNAAAKSWYLARYPRGIEFPPDTSPSAPPRGS